MIDIARIDTVADAFSPALGPWAVVCDFDGTAIVGDIADALALQYLGEDRFRAVNGQYERGEITFRELLHELFDLGQFRQRAHAVSVCSGKPEMRPP